MTTYNTGNPLGSSAPKDLYDNAQVVDSYVNDNANETTLDRFGRARLTIHGQDMRARRSLDVIQNTAEDVIANLGFFPPVDYAPGIAVDSRNFTVTYGDVVYAGQPSAVPFTTGAWDASQWYPIQNLLNQKNLLVFDTYVEASAAAATLPDGQEIEAPNSDGRLSRFAVQSFALVFKDYAPDAIRMQSYTALRAYTGKAQAVDIITPGLSGRFNLDAGDTTTADNGGTLIVGVDGRRWKRQDIKELSPLWFGAKPDAGDGSALENSVAFDLVRAAAVSGKYSVRVPAGVYTLPPGQQMQADGTVWMHDQGAVYRLHSTQSVDTDFLIWLRPKNQKVFNLQIDANRSSQDPVLFGQDRCGGIVISPDDCYFDYVEVIGSPGKGFGLVSAEGEYSRITHLSNLVGGNCNQQVFLVDGNNGLGLFEDCSIDGVSVNETSHNGLAVNDGAYDIRVSNVTCHVGLSSVAEAVLFKDARDCTISNIVGSGGTDAVSFQHLTLGVKRLNISNIQGNGSKGNGVIFLACEDIVGVNVGGQDNTIAGVNIAQLSDGSARCKNIKLTNVVGIDSRATKVQQYGILMAGADGCEIDGFNASGNTVKNVELIESVNTDSRVFWDRTFTANVPSISTTSQATVNIPVSSPIPSHALAVKSAYMFVETTSQALTIDHIAGITDSVVIVVVRNNGAVDFSGVVTVVIGSK